VGAPSGITSGGGKLAPDTIKVLHSEAVGSNYRVTVLVNDTEIGLPIQFQIPVTFKGISSGAASLKIDTTTAQIVGPIAGYAFDFSTVDEGNFTVDGSSTGTGGGTGSG